MLDSATGLYYIGARYMDPELGRWLSLNPELGSLWSPQTLNRYVYCVNNPLGFTDPTGEGFWSKLAKGIVKAVKDNWKTIVIIVAVAAITVATGGAGGVLAAIALGALSQGAMYASEAGSSFSWKGLLVNMGIGAAAGAIGYGAGSVIGKVVGKYASGLGSKMTTKLGGLASRLGMGRGSSGLAMTEGEKVFGAWMGRMEAEMARDVAWGPEFSGAAAEAFGSWMGRMETSAFEYKATGILSNPLVKYLAQRTGTAGVSAGFAHAAEKLFGTTTELPNFQGGAPSY